MSDYTQATDFTAKDSLISGNPAKKILGSEFDTEFAAIATAIGTKFDSEDLADNAEAAALTSDSTLLTPAGLAYAVANADGSSTDQPGFRGLVLRDPGTSNYTAVLGDHGRFLRHESGDGSGDVYTIPANATVAFEVGTTLTFVNLDTNSLSIAITSDTMYLAGTTVSGTRTLAQNGMATAVKVSTTVWLISGPGLT